MREKEKHSFGKPPKPMGKMTTAVILPMVLKIRKTMVLQRIEREGKGRPPHF
jgi:hypothetical protein